MRSFFTNYEMELAGQGVPGLSQPTAVRVSPAVIKLISQPSSQWHLMIYTDPQLLDKLSQWREESWWKSIKLIINSNDKVIVNIHTQETCRRQLIIMHNWECWWFIYFEITPPLYWVVSVFLTIGSIRTFPSHWWKVHGGELYFVAAK